MKFNSKYNLLFCLIIFAGYVQAEKSQKFDAKCHVELVGGGETIYFATTKKKDWRSLAKRLTGASITTAGSRKKQKIYRINECTDLNEDFKTSKAKQLDEETVR